MQAIVVLSNEKGSKNSRPITINSPSRICAFPQKDGEMVGHRLVVTVFSRPLHPRTACTHAKLSLFGSCGSFRTDRELSCFPAATTTTAIRGLPYEKSRADETFLLLSVVGRKGDDGMKKKAIGGKRLQHGA
jgi:hypothetical protein